MKLSYSQPDLWTTTGCCRGPQQAGQLGLEVNASIEALLVLCEISVGIFCEIERMISLNQGGFQIAELGVNPGKTGHVCAPARDANHLRLMLAPAS